MKLVLNGLVFLLSLALVLATITNKNAPKNKAGDAFGECETGPVRLHLVAKIGQHGSENPSSTVPLDWIVTDGRFRDPRCCGHGNLGASVG